MLDELSIRVLHILAQKKAMPFLELASLCDISDSDLQRIIEDFESSDIVKVTNRSDIFEEIITLREKGFTLASVKSLSKLTAESLERSAQN
jgi:DNA-binding MarR family transcriptional regulator